MEQYNTYEVDGPYEIVDITICHPSGGTSRVAYHVRCFGITLLKYANVLYAIEGEAQEAVDEKNKEAVNGNKD